MQDRLLNAYLAGTVDEVVYKAKSNELKSEAAKTDESLAQLGDVGPARGETALALFDWIATGGGYLARFKQCRPSRDPGFGLFEPYFERRKPSHHKEKALRRFRRRARFEE